MNTAPLEALEAKQDDLKILFRSVFETKEGERLLEYFVNKYISKVPSATATPHEIMFMHGNSYVIHDILNKMREEK